MHCLITNTKNRLKNELLDYEFGKQMRCLITKMGNKLKDALPSYEYGKQSGNNKQENKLKGDCLFGYNFGRWHAASIFQKATILRYNFVYIFQPQKEGGWFSTEVIRWTPPMENPQISCIT